MGRESNRVRRSGLAFLDILRWWLPLIIYMVVIFWISSRAVPKTMLEIPDSLLHFGAYFLLGILAVRAFAGGLVEPPRRLWLWCGLAVSFVYALTDEWHQSFVPGRHASGADIIADLLGVLAAGLGLSLFWRIPRNRVVVSDDMKG
jgi:VanZ family protein